MKENDYISIDEFSERAGIRKQTVYYHLNKGLKDFCTKIDGRKMINIDALQFYEANLKGKRSEKMDTEDSNKDSDENVHLNLSLDNDLVIFLEEQIAVKDRQLETKDKQIQDLMEQNRQLIETLKAEQILHGRTQQRLEEPEPINNPPVTQDSTAERQSAGQDVRELERVQEVPTAGNPPEGQQRDDQANEKPRMESKPVKRSFWQRLFGG